MSGLEHAAQLVQFWRAIEMFSPQKVPELTRRSNQVPNPVVVDVAANDLAPWDPDHRLRRIPLEHGKTWQYTVYGGLYNVMKVRDELIRVFGADRSQPDGRRDDTTAMFAFTVNADGALVENSPTLSACAWAMSRLRSPGPKDRGWLDGFEDDELGFIAGLNKLAPPNVGNARQADQPQSPLSRAVDALGRQARAATSEAVKKGAGAAATAAATAAGTALAGPVIGGIAGTVAGTFAEKLLTRPTPSSDRSIASDESPAPALSLTSADLHRFVVQLGEALDIREALGAKGLRIRCTQISKRYAEEASDQAFLNGFLAEDLARVESAVRKGDIGTALRNYLTDVRDVPVERRIDVRNRPQSVVDGVAPQHFPVGRWPGAVHKPLVLSQQFAVNQLMTELGDGAGVFAVNGPPGTGKTTMLRDVLAAIVVERASRLAELDRPARAFTGMIESVQLVGTTYAPDVHGLLPALTGFEIVLATASNDAATNVTAEIPGVAAVAGVEDDVLAADYFTDLASLVLDQDAWGLIAAVLGKMSNRREFVGKFWFGNGSPEPRAQDAGQRSAERTPQSDPTDNAEPAAQSNLGMKDTLAWAIDNPDTVPDWASAVTAFKNARNEVHRLARERQHIADAIAELTRLNTVIAAAWADIESAEALHTYWCEQYRMAQQPCNDAEQAYRQTCDEVADHDRRQPSFWVSLSTLFRAGRRWHADSIALVEARKAAKREFDERKAALAGAEAECASAAALGRHKVQEHRTAVAAANTAFAQVDHARERWPGTVPYGDILTNDERFQLCNAWADEEFSAARHRLFLEALRLHKAFILNAARRIRGNLAAATSLLRNNVRTTPKPETIAAAWQTLFLVVPMVSTTFASLPRLLAGLQRETLGWLFIDEAGQATPQQAAGGLWRARRAVIVGDPQQLEPIVTLPFSAQQAILRHHRLDEEWTPDFTSVQRVADRLARHGTTLPTPDGEDQVWVGAPLRVHRRCDRPMFEVSNRIAYGGDLMVYGTPQRGEFPSENTWFDVRVEEADGNWVPAEGEKLREVLTTLTTSYGIASTNIRVISPFREVVRGAKKIAEQAIGRDFARGNVGTVHTVQGQESDVVILILGTPPDKGGARSWAAAKPNLLNVAVSRAKRRLYVIGNRQLWRGEQYFDDLAAQLRHVSAEP
ncbi:ATP-binding protein [Nocardia sp. NPDC004604]|uniref:DEAD/DEAH box helicase n=1 Tax=Nocardia sp. NPDC004604 TaxID=3157013 RepID=UPI0033AD1D01